MKRLQQEPRPRGAAAAARLSGCDLEKRRRGRNNVIVEAKPKQTDENQPVVDTLHFNYAKKLTDCWWTWGSKWPRCHGSQEVFVISCVAALGGCTHTLGTDFIFRFDVNSGLAISDQPR